MVQSLQFGASRRAVLKIASLIVVAAAVATSPAVAGTANADGLLPIRGFAIAAPRPDRVEEFVRFIEETLQPSGINTLLLRVDHNFAYRSHPELRDPEVLDRGDVRRIAKACRRAGIRIIPQINLLGHQSWREKLNPLLEVYPEFDETPWIDLPEHYQWPNPDGLYCKSYCPLHPEVHEVVFALVDELIDVFEADAFHAGMDEVFYLAEDRCPRCGGRDPAELFAAEVTRIRNHLARRGVELWIWGDRLIDGKVTGIGMWEASMNHTARAIDLIPKDVVICDWHYERADPTAPYFAVKGFTVLTCPWNRPEVAEAQLASTLSFRRHATPDMGSRFAGMLHTVWSDAGDFLDQFYGRAEPDRQRGDPIACTRWFLNAMRELVESEN